MKNYFPRLLYWIMGIAMFFLPISQTVSIICFVALALIWFQQKCYLNIQQAFKELPFLYLFTGFYALHVIGVAWSDNYSFALNDLGIKFTFLVFPVMLGSFTNMQESRKWIYSGFIAGCITACLLCVCLALQTYLQDKNPDVFFYIVYSKFMHPTYFAMYINLAVLMLIRYMTDNERQSAKNNFLILTVIFFLLINTILLSARTAIACTFITIPFCFYLYGKEKKQLKSSVLRLIYLVGFISVAFIFLLQISNRYKQVEDVVMHDVAHPDTIESIDSLSMVRLPDEAFNSTNLRLHSLWPMGFEVFRENWLLGVGTGDVKDKLYEKYTHLGFQYGIRKKLNSHDQYLQTGIALGIPGLLVLLASLFLPLSLALRKKEWIYVGFLLIISVNAITESILEIQNGVLFYAFFSTYFYVLTKRPVD